MARCNSYMRVKDSLRTQPGVTASAKMTALHLAANGRITSAYVGSNSTI